MPNNILLFPPASASGPIPGSGTTPYQMELAGAYDTVSLPLTDIGSELASQATTIVNFRARRGTPGSAGVTDIQLELNGAPVLGAVLSWAPIDGAFALKTIAVSLVVVPGDRISFRLTSAETGGEDIFAEAD